MKRFAICALAVLAMAGAAHAQTYNAGTLWIQPVGGGDEMCVVVSETAVIQLWVEVQTPGYNLVAMDAILAAYAAADYVPGVPGNQNFDVQGFNDYGPWGTFGRRDPRGLITVPGGDINQYQFLGLDENQPWNAQTGLAPGIKLLDEIIIHGLNPTQDLPCPPVDRNTADVVMFSATASPGGFVVFPATFTTGHYYDASFNFGTGANAKGTASDSPLYVAVVVPEPASLSLLLLGGLAAFRRR
jgi:hypothetical protein